MELITTSDGFSYPLQAAEILIGFHVTKYHYLNEIPIVNECLLGNGDIEIDDVFGYRITERGKTHAEDLKDKGVKAFYSNFPELVAKYRKYKPSRRSSDTKELSPTTKKELTSAQKRNRESRAKRWFNDKPKTEDSE
jgi:hypothetical protein